MEKRFAVKETKGIPLDIPKNYFVLITSTTMASYTSTVLLRDADTKREYYSKTRSGINPNPPDYAFFQCVGTNTEIVIDTPQSTQIDARLNNIDFLDREGNLITRSIVIICEDGVDNDYNDVIINITVMKSGA